MKLEDMKVGAFIKCTKPEWDCYGDVFEITQKLPDNKWEITTKPYTKIKENVKKTKGLNPVLIVSQQTLQNNFKINKQQTARKEIKIVCFADNTTFVSDGTVSKNVSMYHKDKYDEFVGVIEALAKLYDRKSPFDEIEELKEAARAAEKPVETTEVSDELSTVENEEEEEEKPEKTFEIKCYSGNNIIFKIIEDKYITYVNPFNQEGNDEFEKIINSLSTHYDRKSPLEEIKELKYAQKAAVKLLGFEDLAEKLYLPEEDKNRHSPVDDMDLTPPLEAGCLIKLKNPYTDKLKGKWFKVNAVEDESNLAMISVFLDSNKPTCKAFQEKDLEVVRESYKNIWDKQLKYQFGDRVVLIQTGFNVKRKSYGTVIDWRQYNNENYYVVHWDDDASRFTERKEAMIPENYLLPVRYE